MSYKRKAVPKIDLSKNPENVRTDVGRKYLEQNKVKKYEICKICNS